MGRVCDVAKLPLGPGQEQESRWHVPACQAEVPNYFPTGAAVYRCVPGAGGAGEEGQFSICDLSKRWRDYNGGTQRLAPGQGSTSDA